MSIRSWGWLILLSAVVHGAWARCIEGEPLLANPLLKKITIEAHSWETDQIVSRICRILLQEHLGYPEVVLHDEFVMTGVFERVAEAAKNKEAYAALEVWISDRFKSPREEYVIEQELVKEFGYTGYNGLSGWYVPAALSQEPYQVDHHWDLRPNRQVAGGRQMTSPLFEQLREQNLSDFLDCRPESGACFPPEVYSEKCQVWCPGNLKGAAGSNYTSSVFEPPLPLLHMAGYDTGYAESQIENNDLNVVIDFFHGSSLAYESQIKQLWSTAKSKPFAFYHWEPSATMVHLNEEGATRIRLPQTQCGNRKYDSVGNWRCDYPSISCTKIASNTLASRAPPAYKLLQKFKIEEENLDQGQCPNSSSLCGAGIKELLNEYRLRASSEKTMGELSEEIACEWVKANQDQGAKWKLWVRREVPAWASVVHWRDYATFSLVLLAVYLALLYLWERCIVGDAVTKSALFTWTCCRRWRCQSKTSIESVAFPQDQPFMTRSRFLALHGTDEGSTQKFNSVIFFASLYWYVRETETSVQIVLLRAGSLKTEVSVKYRTADVDGVAGVNYLHVEGECVFLPGAREAHFEIPILLSPTFDAQKIFHVILQSVAGCDSVGLTDDVCACVEIIDKQTFPVGSKPGTPDSSQFHTWLKSCYVRAPLLFWKAAICKVFCAFQSSVMWSLTPMILIDEAVMADPPRYGLVLVLAAIFLISLLLFRKASRMAALYSGVVGYSKKLRGHLMRKFWRMPATLHMRRERYGDDGRFISSLKEVDCVTKAWSNVYVLIEQASRLVFSCFVIIAVQTNLFQQRLTGDIIYASLLIALWPLLVYWANFSGLAQKEKLLKEHKEADKIALEKQLVWTMNCWSFLASYSPAPLGLEDIYDTLLNLDAKHTRSFIDEYFFTSDSQLITPYVSYFGTLLLFVLGAFQLMEARYFGQSSTTVGSFYAMLSIFSIFRSALSKSFGVVAQWREAEIFFRRIAELLNESDDESVDKVYLAESNLMCSCQGRAVLQFENVSFSYGSLLQDGSAEGCDNISIRIPLGTSLVVGGPSDGPGKQTFIRLLAGVLLPTEGRIVMPAFVTTALAGNRTSDMLPGATLYQNLLITAPPWVTEEHADVIMNALAIKEKGSREIWPGLGQRLSVAVQVARALLNDPHLLLINLKHQVMSSWLRRVCLVLCLWQRSGGLSGLLVQCQKLRSQLSSGQDACRVLEECLQGLEMRALGGWGSKASTLVILPNSVDDLLRGIRGDCFDGMVSLERGHCRLLALRSTPDEGSTCETEEWPPQDLRSETLVALVKRRPSTVYEEA